MAGILAIDHYEIELVLLDQPGKAVGDGVPAGLADHIAQKQ